MRRKLPQLALGSMLLGLFAGQAVAGSESTGVVQLGGGYQSIVSCDGTRISLRRIDDDQVLVSCSERAKRTSLATSSDAGLGQVRLDAGDSTLLLCHGAKLGAKKTGGTQVRANCAPLAVAAI